MSNTNKLQNTAAKIGTAATLGLASIAAHAQTDYSELTGSVDWSDVGTSLLAVGAAVIGITVVFKGIKLVVRMVRGA